MKSRRPRSARLAGALLSALSLAAAALAAAPAPPANGPKPVDPRWHALTGATAVVRPGQTVENATIVVRDGVITAVEPGAEPPAGARVWDLSGHTVYAGFIEPYHEVETPAPDENAPGAHWRSNVTPQRSPLDGEGLTESGRESLRELGFAAAAIAPDSGIFRGAGDLVSLADPREGATPPRLIAARVYHALAPETGGWSGPPPTSLMGAIAVMRQTLMDADWYARAQSAMSGRTQGAEPLERNLALEALGAADAGGPPLLMDARSSQDALRMHKVAEEAGRPAILLGSGQEYQRLDAVAATGRPIIVPLDYPDAPEVASLADANAVSLRELMAWEQAPTNPRRLSDAGVSLALTTHRLDKASDFWPNLRKAVEMGLPADRALAALTINPANLLGAQDRLGTIDAGKLANLAVFEGDPFTADDAELREVWSSGARHEISKKKDDRFDGAWALRAGERASGELAISKNASAVSLESGDDTLKARNVSASADRISFVLQGDALETPGAYRFSAIASGDTLAGTGVAPGGETFSWSASRAPDDDADSEDDAEEETEDADDDLPPDQLPVPFGAFGWLEEPQQESVLVTGVTIWTGGDRGVIEDGALITRGGTVRYVGPASRVPKIAVDRTIDAQGKHVTPGLFDAHSHMGISRGVNEGGEAVTAEVRIQDVIDADDVAWYRALAGGLTMANQLHGSANPIGGQNTVVKLRWGASDPDDYLVKGAPGGIKFALGENVKRRENRYPDTRMGVEALIRDRFIAAREYEQDFAAYDDLSPREQRRTVPPRRDLELEALLEILNGERLIHCHSYRQDEILMLCRVAEEFGFTIGTFQHVLEGYKVAEAIKEHALGGSCFSDWWAYKFEVYDAIPHNGALMHDVGVTVTFNSDSDELARRMNTEAAKAVRYGGVEPHEALKFVTLNAAKQFKVEDRVGSLEEGKDADFVIWSGSPLSSLSRCERTFIDGVEYFSLERDARLRERDAAERQRLIQKIIAKDPPEEEADDSDDENSDDASLADRHREAIALRMLQAGMDPSAPDCGECGFMDRAGIHAEAHNHHAANHANEGSAK